MKNTHYFQRTLQCSLTLLASLTFSNAETIVPKIHEVSSENPISGRDARHTVDGSGLVGKIHAVGESGIAWTSLGNFKTTDYDPYITYDLYGIPRR